jgi:hypothetical protein
MGNPIAPHGVHQVIVQDSLETPGLLALRGSILHKGFLNSSVSLYLGGLLLPHGALKFCGVLLYVDSLKVPGFLLPYGSLVLSGFSPIRRLQRSQGDIWHLRFDGVRVAQLLDGVGGGDGQIGQHPPLHPVMGEENLDGLAPSSEVNLALR